MPSVIRRTTGSVLCGRDRHPHPLDAVNSGFQPGLGAIWFYKVDLDPAVTRTLPDGWKDLDYVVLTSIIRQDPNGLPTVRAAIAHSTTVATFGTGDQQITILQVNRPATTA